MDDLELYGASKDQLDSLEQVVKIFTQDIRMSFAGQARRKQFRVGPAIIGSCVERASRLERSGGMVPREILKFSFSKMHIWCTLGEN